MNVQMIGHACVLITSGDCRILTDPWFEGGAFNDSWELLVPTHINDAILADVTHIWISHEHPDHFHFPTLRSLPSAFKERVTVLFQKLSSRKMVNAFKRLGFTKVVELAHRSTTVLPGGPEIYLYQVGQLDSMLGVREGGEFLLNINDAPISGQDVELIVQDWGSPSTLLNQFSYAGYNGASNPAYELPAKAARVLDEMTRIHRSLGAKTTIPFASFVFFSREDNWELNAHINTVQDVWRSFAADGLDLTVLYPGHTCTIGETNDHTDGLALFQAAFDTLQSKRPLPSSTKSLDEIEAAFRKAVERLTHLFPRVVLKALRPFRFEIPDLGITIQMDFYHARVSRVEGPGYMVVNSQPLWFALQFPFGMQTLGVSGRYRLMSHHRAWVAYRVLFSLQNAELGLRVRHLTSQSTRNLVRDRHRGARSQMTHRLRKMRQGF